MYPPQQLLEDAFSVIDGAGCLESHDSHDVGLGQTRAVKSRMTTRAEVCTKCNRRGDSSTSCGLDMYRALPGNPKGIPRGPARRQRRRYRGGEHVPGHVPHLAECGTRRVHPSSPFADESSHFQEAVALLLVCVRCSRWMWVGGRWGLLFCLVAGRRFVH